MQNPSVCGSTTLKTRFTRFPLDCCQIKLSLAAKGHGLVFSGARNGNIGSVWITDSSISFSGRRCLSAFLRKLKEAAPPPDCSNRRRRGKRIPRRKVPTNCLPKERESLSLLGLHDDADSPTDCIQKPSFWPSLGRGRERRNEAGRRIFQTASWNQDAVLRGTTTKELYGL